MSSIKPKRIFLTGPPGTGKTTLIKKLCEALSQTYVIEGFYTEEIRESDRRIGFDVVAFKGNERIRDKLARNQKCVSNEEAVLNPARVGNYVVFTKNFENAIIPIISSKSDCLLVLDEIGKMELTGQQFKVAIEEAFKRRIILGTIPLHSKNTLIEKIRTESTVFEVNFDNRNVIFDTILKCF